MSTNTALILGTAAIVERKLCRSAHAILERRRNNALLHVLIGVSAIERAIVRDPHKSRLLRRLGA